MVRPISNFDYRMFEEAAKLAELSDFKQIHIGCVITHKRAIIGSGYNSNKTHPLQKRYNKKYRYEDFNFVNNKPVVDKVHAEMAAICNIPYVVGKQIKWSNASIYICRTSIESESGYGNCKPCPACLNKIKDLGMRNVYYTDESGFCGMRLF